MERRASRLRAVAWLFAALVIAAIVVLGGALVIADRSRGPAGPGLAQILETKAYEHRQRTLQDRGVSDAMASQLYFELGELVLELAEVTRAIYGPPPHPDWHFPSLRDVVPIWEPSLYPRLPENFDAQRDYEASRESNAAFLALARQRGVLDTLLEIDRFRGAYAHPEVSHRSRSTLSGVESSVIASLLGMAYIEAVESGDEAGAVAAMQALTNAGAVFAMSGLRYTSPWYPMQTQSWLVRSTIELGLMTPTLARSMLDQMEPIDVADLRVRVAQVAVFDKLRWIADSERGFTRHEPIYGADGRVRFAQALRSVFRSVPARPNSPFAIPRIGFEKRHATLEELADLLETYADASKLYFTTRRADRRADMLPAALPRGASGTAYPIGLEAFWMRTSRTRNSLDEIELLQFATVVLLAIEVYRGEHGGPPASLDDLVPGVLPFVPRNPWSYGGEWRYAVDEKSPLGYRLTITSEPGPHAEGRIPGEESYQLWTMALHKSEYFIMPSAPYHFGP